ncbi:hypothetical protein AB9E14_23430 [Rhizobium leguminosarum]|uniref:hypothetical protein n=1 Tax=Rhizobium leguminosarum TaxID=384 RepID=UPI003F96EA26
MITTQAATVYKTCFGRRFLTKRAAYLAEAMHRLKGKDRHEKQGYDDDSEFYTNEQWDHFKKVSARYYRRFGKRRS